MQMPVDKGEYVPVPEDKTKDIVIPAGASFIRGLEKDIVHIGAKTDFLYYVVVATMFVLFIGFASVLATLSGVLTDTWRHNVNSYIDYQNSERQTAQKFNDFEMRLQQIVEQVSAIKESRALIK